MKVARQELLRQYQDGAQIDALREGVRLLALMELDVRGQGGAERSERTPGRQTSRTGDRERAWDTRVGTIPLRIPKLPAMGTVRSARRGLAILGRRSAVAGYLLGIKEGTAQSSSAHFPPDANAGECPGAARAPPRPMTGQSARE